MTQPTILLAHDLGTTGDKATLFDAATGAPLAATFEAYPTAYPHPNWAEQDPADWQAAVFDGTRRLLEQAGIAPGAVAAVSFSGTMQGALPVDASGQPLRSSIIWADQRAVAESDAICAACGADAIYRLTGLRASPSYTAAKMLWVKAHQPEIFRRTHKVLQVKDYAAFLLTGVLATDYSDASGTQLLDIRARRWASDMAAAIGLSADLLPDLHPSATVIGGVTASAAAATGLLAGTPVVIGGGDGACATVGSGAVTPGDAYTYIGSSAWMALSAAEPLLDPGQRTITMAHLHPQLYFTLGNMQSAGGAYGWLAGLLTEDGADKDFRALDGLAAGAPPGAGGLLFLPHLLGERAPYWNPAARGAFVGLAMPHGRAEVARATLEGVAFHLRLILDALREQGAQVRAMRLIGGGAKSALWRQILADALGLPILLPGLTAEATSLGAAIAGGVGVGLYSDYRSASRLIPSHEAERPNPTIAARYAESVGIYAATYRALEPIFRQQSLATGGTMSHSRNAMLPDTMQAVVCHGPEDYRLEERPVLRPAPGEVLLQVKSAGICASDLKCYLGAPLFWGDGQHPGYCQPPVIPGHEFVGEVIALGAGAAEKYGLALGDIAVSEQIVPCWECRFCKRGQYWMCPNGSVYGFRQNAYGAMAEYILLPRNALIYKVPAAVSVEHAVFVEPLSCSIHAVQRGHIEFGDVVVIAGCGPLGLGMVAAARLKHPGLLIALDLRDQRLAVAKACGADLCLNPDKDDVVAEVLKLTGGYGCDVYIEATGNPGAVPQGLAMIRRLGTFVEFSVLREPVTVDWTIIGDQKEINIHGAHLGPYCYPLALDMLAKRLLPMEQIITHHLSLAAFQEGIDLVKAGDRSIKVTLEP